MYDTDDDKEGEEIKEKTSTTSYFFEEKGALDKEGVENEDLDKRLNRKADMVCNSKMVCEIDSDFENEAVNKMIDEDFNVKHFADVYKHLYVEDIQMTGEGDDDGPSQLFSCGIEKSGDGGKELKVTCDMAQTRRRASQSPARTIPVEIVQQPNEVPANSSEVEKVKSTKEIDDKLNKFRKYSKGFVESFDRLEKELEKGLDPSCEKMVICVLDEFNKKRISNRSNLNTIKNALKEAIETCKPNYKEGTQCDLFKTMLDYYDLTMDGLEILDKLVNEVHKNHDKDIWSTGLGLGYIGTRTGTSLIFYVGKASKAIVWALKKIKDLFGYVLLFIMGVAIIGVVNRSLMTTGKAQRWIQNASYDSILSSIGGTQISGIQEIISKVPSNDTHKFIPRFGEPSSYMKLSETVQNELSKQILDSFYFTDGNKIIHKRYDTDVFNHMTKQFITRHVQSKMKDRMNLMKGYLSSEFRDRRDILQRIDKSFKAINEANNAVLQNMDADIATWLPTDTSSSEDMHPKENKMMLLNFANSDTNVMINEYANTLTTRIANLPNTIEGANSIDLILNEAFLLQSVNKLRNDVRDYVESHLPYFQHVDRQFIMEIEKTNELMTLLRSDQYLNTDERNILKIKLLKIYQKDEYIKYQHKLNDELKKVVCDSKPIFGFDLCFFQNFKNYYFGYDTETNYKFLLQETDSKRPEGGYFKGQTLWPSTQRLLDGEFSCSA